MTLDLLCHKVLCHKVPTLTMTQYISYVHTIYFGLATLCFVSNVAAQESSQTGRTHLKKLIADAIRASNSGRHAQAAHAFHAAYAQQKDAALLSREMMAWLQAKNCAHAKVSATSYLKHQGTTVQGKHMAHEVLAVCYILDAENAIDTGKLDDATHALTLAEQHIHAKEARARLKALHHIITKRHTLRPEHVKPSSPLLGHTLRKDRPQDGWALEGVDQHIAAHVLVYGMVASDREHDRLDDPKKPVRKNRYKDVRRRLSIAHWAIPALYSITRTITREGFVLNILEHEDKSAQSPLKARLLPSWSGGIGARLRIHF